MGRVGVMAVGRTFLVVTRNDLPLLEMLLSVLSSRQGSVFLRVSQGSGVLSNTRRLTLSGTHLFILRREISIH